MTIPRLELVAAILSVKIAALIRRELDTEWKNETFWTDKVVLGYINNNTKKFKILVANQIQQYMKVAMSVNGDIHSIWNDPSR